MLPRLCESWKCFDAIPRKCHGEQSWRCGQFAHLAQFPKVCPVRLGICIDRLSKNCGMLNDIFLFVVLAAVVAILLLLIWQSWKLTELVRKEADWTSITNKLASIEQGQEQVDRSVRDEISRNRQEQSNQSQALRSEVIVALTSVGGSLSSKIEDLTRSNDQKLELLRSAVEQRLDGFTLESGRKFDGLTESVATSSSRLQT